jgi:hypothetical protein
MIFISVSVGLALVFDITRLDRTPVDQALQLRLVYLVEDNVEQGHGFALIVMPRRSFDSPQSSLPRYRSDSKAELLHRDANMRCFLRNGDQRACDLLGMHKDVPWHSIDLYLPSR